MKEQISLLYQPGFWQAIGWNVQRSAQSKCKPFLSITQPQIIILVSCKYDLYLCFSYSLMIDCWNDDKEARPTFQSIRKKIDDIISQEEGCNYMTPEGIVVEPAPSPAVEREEPATQAQCTANSGFGNM